MATVSMKDFLEAGVHFGHHTRRWNPKMRPYIFTERNGIHIIDLQQTINALEIAYQAVRDTVAEGGIVLFTGTKRQAQDTVVSEAMRCGMPYVSHRWLGGTLTNFRTIRKRVDYMLKLEAQHERGELNVLPKKEALGLTKLLAKLNRRFGGLRTMRQLPDLVFIVDTHREDIAVKECNTLDIPIVAMVDTNCDPDPIEYVIPSNDDAIRAIKLLTGRIADAALEGKGIRQAQLAEAEAAEMEEEVDTTQRVFEPFDDEPDSYDDEYYDDEDEDYEYDDNQVT